MWAPCVHQLLPRRAKATARPPGMRTPFDNLIAMTDAASNAVAASYDMRDPHQWRHWSSVLDHQCP
jgi:hypothetical protein